MSESDDQIERSESGAPIWRYEERERGFELAVGDSDNIERISDHIEAHVGPVETVFHELISDLVHVDVHLVAPTEDRDFYTLVTSGMSDLPMAAPEAYPDLQYSELMICLPPDWKMAQKDWEDESWYWPIRLLKQMARFPHEYGTWLWLMHTVPNGDPPEPWADNTDMCGVIVLPPITVPPEFHELVIDDEKTIYFHALLPLHEDEMNLKLQQGVDPLFDLFDERQISEILDPGRSSTIKKRPSWWPFRK